VDQPSRGHQLLNLIRLVRSVPVLSHASQTAPGFRQSWCRRFSEGMAPRSLGTEAAPLGGGQSCPEEHSHGQEVQSLPAPAAQDSAGYEMLALGFAMDCIDVRNGNLGFERTVQSDGHSLPNPVVMGRSFKWVTEPGKSSCGSTRSSPLQQTQPIADAAGNTVALLHLLGAGAIQVTV
jgi:hypothetical protein